jgi:hypothetical protein
VTRQLQMMFQILWHLSKSLQVDGVKFKVTEVLANISKIGMIMVHCQVLPCAPTEVLGFNRPHTRHLRQVHELNLCYSLMTQNDYTSSVTDLIIVSHKYICGIVQLTNHWQGCCFEGVDRQDE